MSLQFLPNQNTILNAFQRTGLHQGQSYQKEQLFSALDKLSGELYDRDVAQQLFEQCQTNQRGQVQLEDFAAVILEADKVLKKKINQTEQQIKQFQDELRDCQKQAQEQQYTQQLNSLGVDRDSQLSIVVKSASNLQFSDFQYSYVEITVEHASYQTQLSTGDKFNPSFNNQLNFPIQNGSEEIILRLFVQDRNQKKTLIGMGNLDLGSMHDQQVHTQSLQLINERGQIINTYLQIESQWIHNKLKYHQEMILRYEQTIQQYQNDIDDYQRDLLTVQKPFLETNIRNSLQQSLARPQQNNSLQSNQNQAFLYQQQQQVPQPIYPQQPIKVVPPQQKTPNQTNLQIQNQPYNGQSSELSDELYYGFILYILMLFLALFQCFARPDYIDIILAMLYLLIVCRDCLEQNYIKIVGGVTVLSIVLDVVWISFYKHWWNGTDNTLPTWGEAGDPIVRMTIVFCIFNIILKTALCYILFHYYKASQDNQTFKFEFWQFEFPVGILKQNIFTQTELLR